MKVGPAEIIEASTDELLAELARRLDVATGRVKVELIFVNGRLEDGYRHHRLCACRRHAWSPTCPVHPPRELDPIAPSRV